MAKIKKLSTADQFVERLAIRMRDTLIRTSEVQDVIEPSQKLVNQSTLTIAQLASGLEKLASIAKGVERDLGAVSGHMAELSMEQLIDQMAIDLTVMANFMALAPYEAKFVGQLLDAVDKPILIDAFRGNSEETRRKIIEALMVFVSLEFSLVYQMLEIVDTSILLDALREGSEETRQKLRLALEKLA